MDLDFQHIHRQFPAAAEYLGGIYILQRDYGFVAHSHLAAWLGVSSPAVSQAVGRLKRLGLAQQKRYENVALTDEGRSLAVKVLRRHYLIERLLVETLGYPWDKADEEAKLLQSQISDSFAEHLYERLGAPETCPHGNPMPGSAAESRLLGAAKLSEGAAGSALRVVRITEEGEQVPDMLSFCDRNGVRPGARFLLDRRSDTEVTLRGADAAPRSDARAPVVVPMAMALHIRYELITR